MTILNYDDVVQYVEQNIGSFHQKRLANLKSLQLARILKRKNPYLFKAKNITTAGDLIKQFLDAHLSSQEEALFGDFLEGLAIFICGKTFGGRKSSAEGIDLEFERDGVRYIVTIKFGPNWGNSQQYARMRDNFKKTVRILGTSGQPRNVVAVNGCCYGKDDKPDKGDYMKLCGQRFWEFISGDENLFIGIIEPLGHKAKMRNEEFAEEYAAIANKFTQTFIADFCGESGAIDWEKLVAFNSGKRL